MFALVVALSVMMSSSRDGSRTPPTKWLWKLHYQTPGDSSGAHAVEGCVDIFETHRLAYRFDLARCSEGENLAQVLASADGARQDSNTLGDAGANGESEVALRQ